MGGFEANVYAPEDLVNVRVATGMLGPAFDDCLVVAEDADVCTMLGNGDCEELEADGFGPLNVAAAVCPAVAEEPCTPKCPDDDGNADAGAGIGKCADVSNWGWARDWARAGGMSGEPRPPPPEIRGDILGTSVWHERTVTQPAHEGRQVGEKSAAHGGDSARVHELPVKGLRLKESVRARREPRVNCKRVLCALLGGDGDRARVQVPEEPDVDGATRERRVFLGVPDIAERGCKLVNVAEAVCEEGIVERARG